MLLCFYLNSISASEAKHSYKSIDFSSYLMSIIIIIIII